MNLSCIGRHEPRFADTDEKRTLIGTDASHRRLTLMIFQIFHPCESVFIRERLSVSSIYGTGITNGGSPMPMKM